MSQSNQMRYARALSTAVSPLYLAVLKIGQDVLRVSTKDLRTGYLSLIEDQEISSSGLIC